MMRIAQKDLTLTHHLARIGGVAQMGKLIDARLRGSSMPFVLISDDASSSLFPTAFDFAPQAKFPQL